MWAFALANMMDLLLALVVLALALWAVVDCATKGALQFQRAGKRTKGFWLALTGGAALAGAFNVLLLSGNNILMLLFSAIAAGTYLADVRPAVSVEPKGPAAW